MRLLTYTGIAIFSFSAATLCLDAQVLKDAVPETVHLGYELTLTSCKASDCHADSAAKGVADIVLNVQGADGSSGVQTVQMQADGVNYTVAIKASSLRAGPRRGCDAERRVKSSVRVRPLHRA